MSQYHPTGPTGPGIDPTTGAPYPTPVPPRQRSWASRHKALTALGVFAVLGVVISVASQGGGSANRAAGSQVAASTASSQQAASAGASAAPNDGQPAAVIGKPVRDGKLEFTVTQVETGVKRVGSDVIGQDAQGQFVLLHLTVTNIGTEAQFFDGSSQKLHDSAGRTFSADTAAAIYLDASHSFLNQINPGNTVQGIVVFDVPADAALTTAEVHDSAFSGGVAVALG